MAEPVSSIVALVVTAAKLGALLNNITQSVRDAPAAITNAWFGYEKTRPPKNIQKDVKAILASCMDTFRELEESVEGLKPGAWNKRERGSKTALVHQTTSNINLKTSAISHVGDSTISGNNILEVAHPSLPAQPEREHSACHIHPVAAASQMEDRRHMSISSEYTATDSEVSGVSDLTLSDLDVQDILRPGSIYSLDSSTAGPDTVIPTSNITKQRRLVTLQDILHRRTIPPYSLFEFYIYMRDVQRSVDYLDTWLDLSQHQYNCRSYVREIQKLRAKESETPNDRPLSNVDEWTIEQISTFLRTQTSSEKSLEENASLPIKRKDLRAYTQNLLHTFFLSGSQRKIKLPLSVVNPIIDTIEGSEQRDDPDVFLIAKDYIFMAMQRDAYPHFMKRRRAML
ncbi:hypothetical protein CC78DRAFT_564378 [Lojkania enalia]|uniref:RGS domain-containing protein n=1 Tax=Lojkania enalia TaxID=147567 RepID=A0A9P4TQN5_9PLEO|nr:hypothetical protein CC78DRAFT_564378 [Didymosphaeria enalia]